MKWFLFLIFSVVSLTFISQLKIDTCISSIENLKKHTHAAYRYGNLIPRNLDEAIIILMHRPSIELNRFISLEKKDAIKKGLSGHGANLSHSWRLHQESVLTTFFNENGVYSSKTMYVIILDLLYTYIKEEKYCKSSVIQYYLDSNKKEEKKARRIHKTRTNDLIKKRKKIKKENKKKSIKRKKEGDPNPLLIN